MPRLQGHRTHAHGLLPSASSARPTDPKAEIIVKAQAQCGGRGKGHFDNGFKSGVHILNDPAAVEEAAGKMIGANIITKQTPEAGLPVSAVLVNEGITINRETYVAFLMDRAMGGPCFVGSTQGGMDIEEVAETNPDAIVKQAINIETGLTDALALELADKLEFKGSLREAAAKNFQALYKLFLGTDATQVEINPMAEGSVPGQGVDKVFAVDAKLNFDDNAQYRQKEIFAMRDISTEDPRDLAAEAAGLNYIGLDGNIGCLVNGAGLAMATMDICKQHGGEPANFLDMGGSATADQVTQAFEILRSDEKVEAILVNIFGGIMRCDTIANGIVEAARRVDLGGIPLVVRLAGTNVEAGKDILSKSGIAIITADDLDDAAAKAVAAIKK